MSRLPSHGFTFGSPPKLQGHETLQLQLSATVAVICQLGVAARGARSPETATKQMSVATSIRITGASWQSGILPDISDFEG